MQAEQAPSRSDGGDPAASPNNGKQRSEIGKISEKCSKCAWLYRPYTGLSISISDAQNQIDRPDAGRAPARRSVRWHDARPPDRQRPTRAPDAWWTRRLRRLSTDQLPPEWRR